MKSNTKNTNSMNSNAKTLLTLAAGAVAGAVTALLLAPQTGEEARRALRRTASRVKDDLNTTVQSGIERINNLRGDMEETAGESFSDGNLGRRQTTGRTAGTGSTGSMGSTGSAAGSTGSTGLSGSSATTGTASRTNNPGLGNV